MGRDRLLRLLRIMPQFLTHAALVFFQLFDSEGYFHTGDLGFFDGQGIVHFLEKIDNLIHFWMYEVAPTILESRLLGSNNIVDAAVVAIPDKENGQASRKREKALLIFSLAITSDKKFRAFC